MSHLDEGTLHALLDGELETNEVAEIQAHLGSCSSCGLRLREVKEFYGEADRLIASVDLQATAAHDGAHAATAGPLGPRTGPGRGAGAPRHAASAAGRSRQVGALERAAASPAGARQRVGGRSGGCGACASSDGPPSCW